MSEDRRRTILLLSAIAGAAGLAIGALIMARRHHDSADLTDKTVADVLSDCYTKMREIQSHLTELAPVLGAPLPEKA